MDYIVLKQEPYGEVWHRHDCYGEEELKVIVLGLIRTDGEVVVTVPVDFSITVSLAKLPPEVIPARLEKPAKTKTDKEAATDSGATESKPEGS